MQLLIQQFNLNLNIIYINIQTQMQGKQISYLSQFLRYTFFESVQKFQEMVDQMTKDQSLIIKIQQKKSENLMIVIKKMNQLNLGQNISKALKIIVHRIVNYNNYSFFLASQFQPTDKDSFFCIIVTSTEPIVNQWDNQIGLNKMLIIKQPFVNNIYPKTHKMLTTVQVKIQNAVLLPNKDWKSQGQELKSKGNQYFKNQDYNNALLYYEQALTCFEFGNSKKDRAILYANASASFYQMKLYDLSIKYAKISVKLDKTYAKGYFRLIKSLLQIQDFNSIPSLLVSYSQTTDADNLNKLNQKYTYYTATSLGIFKWSQILFKKTNQFNFSNYVSHKILRDQFNSKIIYFANQDLKMGEVLLIQKPKYFKQNSNHRYNLEEIYSQIERYIRLENAFKSNIQALGKKSTQLLDNKPVRQSLQQYVLQLKQLTGYSLEYVKGYGIWSGLFYFFHSCQPNCSYVHFKKSLIVTTTRKIKKGEFLSIDFASHQKPLNRKAYIKKKLKVDCLCEACQWREWPQQSTTYIEKITLCDYLQNNLMLKQLLLSMLQDKKSFAGLYQSETSYKDVVQRYLKVVRLQTHWVDISHMLELSSSNDILKSTKSMLQKVIHQKIDQIFELSVQRLGDYSDKAM